MSGNDKNNNNNSINNANAKSKRQDKEREITLSPTSNETGIASSNTTRKVNNSVVYRSILTTQSSAPPLSYTDAAETTTLSSLLQDNLHISTDSSKNNKSENNKTIIIVNNNKETSNEEESICSGITPQQAPWLLDPIDTMIRCHLSTDKDISIAIKSISMVLEKESIANEFTSSNCSWRCSGASMGSFNIVLYSLTERESSDLYALNIESNNATSQQITSLFSKMKENVLFSQYVHDESESSSLLSQSPVPRGRSMFLGTTPRLSSPSPNQAAALKSLIDSFANHPFADIRYDLEKLVELSSAPVTVSSSR